MGPSEPVRAISIPPFRTVPKSVQSSHLQSVSRAIRDDPRGCPNRDCPAAGTVASQRLHFASIACSPHGAGPRSRNGDNKPELRARRSTMALVEEMAIGPALPRG